MNLFKRRNGNAPSAEYAVTPPFATASDPFTAEEHREAAARAYVAWRRYLSEEQAQEVQEVLMTGRPATKSTKAGRNQRPGRVTKAEHDKFMRRLYGQQRTTQRRVKKARG